jgi:hypothetical protein
MVSGTVCFCQCPYGFSGQFCQTCQLQTTTTQQPINPCLGYTCMNGGTAMVSGTVCFCQCPAGYMGQFCQTCNCSF